MQTNPTGSPSDQGYRTLQRCTHSRMAGGVAAGVAEYLDADVTLIRLAIVALAILGIGVPLYLAAWLLIPDEDSDRSIAELWLHRKAW